MTATAIASSRDGRGVFLLGAAASASAAGGHAVAGPGVPEVVLAAAALAADGVSFLLVGSAAVAAQRAGDGGRCGRGDQARPGEPALPPCRAREPGSAAP